VSQIEDLIASKVDAIIIAAVSGPGTVGAVEAAAAAGIPVINVNVMTDSDKVVTRIRSDDDVIGRMQADFMGERLKGAGNVVMLRGAPGYVMGRNSGQRIQEAARRQIPEREGARRAVLAVNAGGRIAPDGRFPADVPADQRRLQRRGFHRGRRGAGGEGGRQSGINRDDRDRLPARYGEIHS
jgi:hypothetical protein